MQYKDERFVILGMNYQDNPAMVEKGEYIYAENLTIDPEDKGIRTNQKSSQAVAYTLPTGTNTCIGSKYDPETDTLVYLVANSLGSHSILELDCASKIISPILAPKAGFGTGFLNFSTNHLVHSINVFHGHLTWTDNFNPPRHIEIVNAKAFMNGTPPSRGVLPYDVLITAGTLEQKEQYISAIKYPPLFPPTFTFETDSSVEENKIYGKTWQFRYRWVYSDFSRSVFSPASKIALPPNIETTLGVATEEHKKYNTIRLWINTGHPRVIGIEIAVRLGNYGQWSQILDTVWKFTEDNVRTHSDYLNVIYDFRDQKNTVALPDSEVAKNFHDVPILAKTQEYLRSNMLVYGNIEMGRDNIPLNVWAKYNQVEEVFKRGAQYLGGTYPASPIWPIVLPTYTGTPGDSHFFSFGIIDDWQVGSCISIIYQIGEDIAFNGPNTFTLSHFHIITSADLINWPNNLIDALAAEMQPSVILPNYYSKINWQYAVFSRVGGSLKIAIYYNPSGQHPPQNYIWVRFWQVRVGNPVKKIATWKAGATHRFGLVYSDGQGRHSTVNHNNDCDVYISPLEVTQPGETLFRQHFSHNITIDIRHLPPAWAKTLQIVYGGMDKKRFFHFVVSGPSKREVSGGATGEYMVLPIADVVDYISQKQTIGFEYAFSEGDVMQIIADDEFTIPGASYVAKIISFDPTLKNLTIEGIDFKFLVGTIIEVYTPGNLNDTIYQEIGEVYPIVGGYHTGNVRNQNLGNPATIRIESFNAILKNRTFDAFVGSADVPAHQKPAIFGTTYNALDVIVEADEWSDFYPSQDKDYGRANVFGRNMGQKRFPHKLIHGGKFLVGAQTNSLFNFDSSNEFNVNISFGPITRLMEVGDVLKILQPDRLSSIYIQKRYMEQSGGARQLVLTDDIYGEYVIEAAEFGSAHAESAVTNRRSMYFYDGQSGKIIRSSANGQFPISDYKLQKFASQAGRKRFDKVISGYDYNKNLFYITFINQEEFSTVIFDEEQNRWVSFHTYNPPEQYGTAGGFLVGFKNGAVHIFEHGTGYGNYMGQLKEQVVEFPSNIDPNKLKVFDNLSIYSNVLWAAYSDGDITIPANGLQKTGMRSRLIESKFRWKDGITHAEFLRDMETPGYTDKDRALLFGRRLEGSYATIKLRNSNTEKTELRGIIVYSTPTEKTK